MRKPTFQCKFCDTSFVQETRFVKHNCKFMKRDEVLKTHKGQSAWLHYQKWMKCSKKNVNQKTSFIYSKFFTTFVKFEDFSKKVHINTTIFIKQMCERNIPPTMWTDDGAYGIYLEYMDKRARPNALADITIDTLIQIATDAKIDTGDIFDNISVGEIIRLIQQRRLSPWILLNSVKFKKFFVSGTTESEKTILQALIRPHFWTEKFNKHPKIVERMKRFVSGLNL